MPVERDGGAWRRSALAIGLLVAVGATGCFAEPVVAPAEDADNRPSRAPRKPLNPPPEARKALLLVSDEWMPYTGRQGGREGFVTELAKEALRRAGHEVRYEARPWNRCLADVGAGLADAVLCADPSEAPDLVFSREPIAVTKPTLFVHRGFTVGGRRWRYDGEASLEGLRLSVVDGYRYAEPIRRYVERHRGSSLVLPVRGEDPVERQVRALLAGRVDVFAQNELVVRWRLRGRLEASRIELAGRTPEGRLYVAFSPKRRDARDIAAAFDRELRVLWASGQAAAIERRYGLGP
ncbi:MAG: transporter substrate-binding domain-containing protein [Fimbriimonadales bacterium]|nr:transporter substrate-binding domain-containing protein [Fimbriimonadales bacterium]